MKNMNTEKNTPQPDPVGRESKKRMIRIFIGLLIAPTLLWAIFCLVGAVSPSFKEKTDYDLNEKRQLASFPSSFSGNWCAEIEDFYNDHLPFRSLLITADTKLKTLREAPYNNGIRDTLVSLFHPSGSGKQETAQETSAPESTAAETAEPSVTQSSVTEVSTAQETSVTEAEAAEPASEDTTAAGTDTAAFVSHPDVPTEAVDDSSYFAPVISNNYTILGRENWLFMAANLDYYLGTDLPTDEELRTYADTLSTLQALCDQKGKKLAVLMVPSKPQIYPEYMPTYVVEDSYKRMQRIADYVTANTSVKFSYPLDELTAMKDTWLVYKKYDSHWNAAGSFIGYQEILKMLGMEITDPRTVTADMSAVGSGGGDLISTGGLDLAIYQNDYDYFLHYRDETGMSSSEGTWAQDHEYYRMYSNAACTDRISIIGDSFRNHMMLYAYKDFQDSSLIHVYQLSDGTADQLLADSDIYVLLFAERNGSLMLSSAQYLTDLLSRQ